ncbi:MAG: ATP-grasp domain-containing protein [Gammaproteobacteria bacterium]
MTKKLCIIVDGYSTGRQYASLLNQKSYNCLHIQSSMQLPTFITSEMTPSDYCATYIHNEDDFQSTLQWIISHGYPEFIIPGSDTATVLCDKLSDALKLTLKNPLASSQARRDKFEMGERIKNCGLIGIKQLKAKNFNDITSWIKEEGVEFPLVVKPLKSGSGEGFRFCRNIREVELAFFELLGQKDLFNQVNEALLIQEYIQGDEYVINTVSCAGQHLVSEFGIYQKKINEQGNSIYQSLQFFPRNFDKSRELKKYAFAILDALDIHYGPSHMEVMWTHKGPILIEVGARPVGGGSGS